VFDNEHSLHLWERHPCTSTVERQLTDWREQVTTWRDLRGFLYNHSDIVCLLIQSNCIELQQPINILIWVAWLFNHPVLWTRPQTHHSVSQWDFRFSRRRVWKSLFSGLLRRVEIYRRFRGPCCLHHQGDGQTARRNSPGDSHLSFKTSFDTIPCEA
jgi:hypothetical protein